MTQTQTLAGLSILLLEDSYFLAEETQRTLEAAGARVLAPCRDLDEMRKALQHNHPDCALVDINLGNGPTFEPARTLRAASVPIILLTGYDVAVIPPDLMDAPCLLKPVDGFRLISTVASTSRRLEAPQGAT